MKKIEAIIKPFKLSAVKNALHEIDLSGMTVIEVKGFGRQRGQEGLDKDQDFDDEFHVKVKIEKSFSRASKGGVGYAKAAGNYAAQFYPTMLARDQGYQQIIWTDSSSHEFIEEAGTMNLFFRIDDTLITPPTSDSILDGITRKSLPSVALLGRVSCS